MALKNLLNTYFTGKSGKADFTREDLPETRGALFFTVLKVRFWSLPGANLFYVVSCLPAAFWAYLNAATALSLLDGQNGAADLLSLLMTFLVILCPLIVLTGPFKMGLAYVMRNWARDEHAFALGHFKEGLKSNWKQGLLYGLIAGLVPLVTGVCGWYYANLTALGALRYLPLALVFIIALLWSLTALILPTLIVTYELRFRDQLRNALLMTLSALPKAFGIRLVTLLVPMLLTALGLVFPGIIDILLTIGVALYLFLMPALNALIEASFANALCERHINTRIAGARVDMGLKSERETGKEE